MRPPPDGPMALPTIWIYCPTTLNRSWSQRHASNQQGAGCRQPSTANLPLIQSSRRFNRNNACVRNHLWIEYPAGSERGANEVRSGGFFSGVGRRTVCGGSVYIVGDNRDPIIGENRLMSDIIMVHRLGELELRRFRYKGLVSCNR